MSSREYFLQKYINIHVVFKLVLEVTAHLNETFPIMAKNLFDSKQKDLDRFLQELHNNDFETWKVITSLYSQLSISKQPNVNGLSPHTLKIWLHLINDGANYQHSIIFIHETILINLITKFNEFLKDTLKIAFSLDPQTKDSWKTMNDEQRETKVFHLVEDDIKEAAITIRKIFGLDLKKELDWKDFVEYTYRRHIFIHNHGFPSEKYRKRTGYKGPSIKLSIDKDYITKGISLFKKYSEIIEEFFIEKHLDMVNITKKSNIIKIDLTKNGGQIIPDGSNHEQR